MFNKDSTGHTAGVHDKKPVAPASTAKAPDAKVNPADKKASFVPGAKPEAAKK